MVIGMMIGLDILKQLVFGFITAVGFAFIWRVPRHRIPLSGLAGALGWLVYWAALQVGIGNTISTFLGAYSIAFVSFLIARRTQAPATLYNIPAITLLVPGAGSYRMMHSLITGDYHEAITHGINVIGLAGAIAGGLIVFEVARRHFKPLTLTKMKRKL